MLRQQVQLRGSHRLLQCLAGARACIDLHPLVVQRGRKFFLRDDAAGYGLHVAQLGGDVVPAGRSRGDGFRLQVKEVSDFAGIVLATLYRHIVGDVIVRQRLLFGVHLHGVVRECIGAQFVGISLQIELVLVSSGSFHNAYSLFFHKSTNNMLTSFIPTHELVGIKLYSIPLQPHKLIRK